MKISVVYSPGPRDLDVCDIEVPEGTNAAQALVLSGLPARHEALAHGGGQTGIWGRRCARDAILAPGDRLEVYRPLQIDPKEARRARGRRLRKGQAAAAKPRG